MKLSSDCSIADEPGAVEPLFRRARKKMTVGAAACLHCHESGHFAVLQQGDRATLLRRCARALSSVWSIGLFDGRLVS
jgi:hypothetical protein